MYFNFRYAGGLGQYWVIIMSYMILQLADKLPMPRFLRHRPFNVKEHCLVTLVGTAAAFSQSLGLSGGLAPLTLYYNHNFNLFQLFVWTAVAASFGIFVGIAFGKLLVLNDRYPWPVARMNADTIASFHTGDPSGQHAAVRVFLIFFCIVFPWYLASNGEFDAQSWCVRLTMCNLTLCLILIFPLFPYNLMSCACFSLT